MGEAIHQKGPLFRVWSATVLPRLNGYNILVDHTNALSRLQSPVHRCNEPAEVLGRSNFTSFAVLKPRRGWPAMRLRCSEPSPLLLL